MSWPLPDEINEAIQTLSLSFADPDLKGGQPVLGASGFPLPGSGNFADVYQVVGADGREWAVKCFTRPATGLDKRYDKVATALAATPLPFAVEFAFLKEGLRVRDQWYPVVKMAWVEGLQLNQFVRENASRPAVLDNLLALWVKLAHRLRDAGIAHADIQHGNVMLVAGAKTGTLGLKLLDYDGMYIPALANQPSGERGHSAFQHPERLAQNVYSPDLDRFPHLVVATALKGLAVLGKALWDRFDTGDNLLFTETDFKNPAGSKLLRELWQSGNADVRSLTGRLAIACRKPITQTPWLDQIAPDGHPTPLTSDEERDATAALGLATAARPVMPTPAKAVPAPVASRPRPSHDEEDEIIERRLARPAPSRVPLLLALLAGLALLGMVGVGAAVYLFVLHPGEAVTQATSFPTYPLPTSPPVMSQTPSSSQPQPQPKTTPTTKTPPTPQGSDPKLPNPNIPGPSYQKEVVDANFAPNPTDAMTYAISWSVTATDQRDAIACSAVFTADGTRVAVSRLSAPGIVILDAATGALVREIKTSSEPLGLLALSNGTVAVYLTGSPGALVFNPETGLAVRKDPTANYAYHEGEIHSYAGDRIVGTVQGTYLGGWRPVTPPAPNANRSNIPPEPGVLTVYNTETGKPVVDTLTSRGRLGFTPQGHSLLLVEAQGRLRWYDLANKSSSEVKFADEKGGWVRALSPDATRFLYYGLVRDNTTLGVHLVNATTGRSVLTLPPEYSRLVTTVAGLSVGGAVIAIHGPVRPDRLSQVDLLDGRTGRLLGVVLLNESYADLHSMTFSPDGRRLLLARTKKGRVQMIDLPFEAVAAVPKQPMTPELVQPKPPDPIQPKPKPKRGSARAVPPDDAVAQAEADLREVYKADFAKKTAADKKALANQLIDLAGKTPDDPTARYTMLRLARDLAAEAQDGTLVVRAIDELGRLYEVPAADQKAAALEKILAATQQQAALRELADLALTTADKVILQDGFDAAVRLTQVAASAARRGVLPGADEFDARLATVKKLRDVFNSEVKVALATLATNPSDPVANQVVGKFRCFHQGRWADGVRHLAQSDSLILKTAADAESARDAADAAKAGDAWWEVSRITTDPMEKKQADARAKLWYLRALPKLTGLALARAQTRLSVTVGNVTFAPGLIAEFSSTADVFKGLKGRIETTVAYDGKEFTPPDGGIVPRVVVRWSGVVIPPKPGKYRLFAQVRNAEWDQLQIAVNKTTVISTTVKKAGSGVGKTEATVMLTDKPTPLLVTFNTHANATHGLKLTWIPITALGDGDETLFAESLFHDKKAESVLK